MQHTMESKDAIEPAHRMCERVSDLIADEYHNLSVHYEAINLCRWWVRGGRLTYP